MNYHLEIEKYFENEEGLSKIIEDYRSIFDRVDEISDLFLAGAIRTPAQIQEMIIELTGLYITLNTVSNVAEGEKINRENKAYHCKRIEIENDGKKAVSAFIEREASLEIASYRRVRNLFCGYRDSCDKAIISCQSVLRNLEKEERFSHNQT